MARMLHFKPGGYLSPNDRVKTRFDPNGRVKVKLHPPHRPNGIISNKQHHVHSAAMSAPPSETLTTLYHVPEKTTGSVTPNPNPTPTKVGYHELSEDVSTNDAVMLGRKPHRHTTAPHRNTTEPHRNTTAPHRNTTAPHRNTTEPHRNTTAPHRNTTEPHRNTTETAIPTDQPIPTQTEAEQHTPTPTGSEQPTPTQTYLRKLTPTPTSTILPRQTLPIQITSDTPPAYQLTTPPLTLPKEDPTNTPGLNERGAVTTGPPTQTESKANELEETICKKVSSQETHPPITCDTLSSGSNIAGKLDCCPPGFTSIQPENFLDFVPQDQPSEEVTYHPFLFFWLPLLLVLGFIIWRTRGKF